MEQCTRKPRRGGPNGQRDSREQSPIRTNCPNCQTPNFFNFRSLLALARRRRETNTSWVGNTNCQQGVTSRAVARRIRLRSEEPCVPASRTGIDSCPRSSSTRSAGFTVSVPVASHSRGVLAVRTSENSNRKRIARGDHLVPPSPIDAARILLQRRSSA